MIHIAVDGGEKRSFLQNLECYWHTDRARARLVSLFRTHVEFCSVGWAVRVMSKTTLNRWIFEWSLVDSVERKERDETDRALLFICLHTHARQLDYRSIDKYE